MHGSAALRKRIVWKKWKLAKRWKFAAVWKSRASARRFEIKLIAL
jgi:hypothetical protein